MIIPPGPQPLIDDGVIDEVIRSPGRAKKHQFTSYAAERLRVAPKSTKICGGIAFKGARNTRKDGMRVSPVLDRSDRAHQEAGGRLVESEVRGVD